MGGTHLAVDNPLWWFIWGYSAAATLGALGFGLKAATAAVLVADRDRELAELKGSLAHAQIEREQAEATARCLRALLPVKDERGRFASRSR